MNYKVYRNLNNGKISIKDSSTGLVVGHADVVDVFNAKFKVSNAGVMRIRREKRKAVVATINGGISWLKGFVPYKGRDVTTCYPSVEGGTAHTVRFNPYKYDTFVEGVSKNKVTSAVNVAVYSTGEMIAWGLNK